MHHAARIGTLRRLIGAALLGAGLAWSDTGEARVRTPGARWIDAGDGFRRRGTWTALGRVADEWVVPAVDADRLVARQAAEPLPAGPAHGALRLVRRRDPSPTPRLTVRGLRDRLDAVRQDDGGARADPVFADPRTGLRLVPRGQIVVRLAAGATPGELPPVFAAARRLPGTADQYLLACPALTAEAMLEQVSALNDLPQVVWAEPDFLKEWRRHRMLNDPLLGDQWHLRNNGYWFLSGTPYSPAGVDIDAPVAWDRQTGSVDVVIAVIDDGVQAAHPDLQPNLYANPFEIAGNGVDDDGNGYPDDVSGWDFINATNTPEPKVADDRHGVATAGLAAARGDNGIGGSGVAPFCRILPVKIFQGDTFVGSSALANAIRYAAGLTTPAPWRGADVLNMSFGGGAPALVEDSAFTDAALLGRQGKGCVLVASSGNSASDYYPFQQQLAPGTYYFEWRYRKDPAVSFGDDTCRLGLVRFPDGTVERFDQPTPPAGWNFKPEADKPGWMIEDNPAKSFGLGRYQARAQITQNNSYALCRSKPVTFTTSSSIIFYYWISSEASYDFIEFRAVKTDAAPPPFAPVDSGVYPTDPYVAYPASHADVIAVGASTEFDYRSYFSQYGSDLDLVAPGGGGLVGIATTDRTGADGYASGDETTQFSGTSASAPIVSGAAALLLSRHPDLTAAAVRSLLRRTADKVGGLAYTGGEADAGGRSEFLGYGRLNAGRLLGLARVTVHTGVGGVSATADAATDFFCEPVQAPTLAAQAADYFTFGTWEAEPPAHASIFTPAAAGTVAAIYDDVALTATFDPLLAALGTPLHWLAAHGLTAPDFDTAEADDADADGHAAWQEWLAGTDPGDDASVLRMTAFQRLADGRCVVSWSSVSNRVYDILSSVAPAGTEPEQVAQGLAATAPLNVHTTAPLPAATRFIRVRATPP